MRPCGQCNTPFEVTEQDQEFYAKISVPSPTRCPDCRRQRRLAFRNERALYSRACDLCKKQTVSFYSSSYPGPVYCQTCWWSDKWDPFSFGRPYDQSRPFFSQLKELFRAVPLVGMANMNSENSEFTAHSSRNKNCYMCISALSNEESYYSFQITECNEIVDAAFTRGCTLGYELVDCEKTYNCSYCQQSSDCTDSMFLYDCRGCTNCFFSVNLRNRQYVYRDEQLSKEMYEKKIAEITRGGFGELERLKGEFMEFVQKNTVHKFAAQTKCEQVTGNYLLNCSNSFECFDARELENCKYIVVSPGPTRDCYDVNYCVFGSELFCDVLSNVNSSMGQQYCQYSWETSHSQYCSYVMFGENCFGSQGLRKATYCILNKQYTEHEYTKLRAQIVEDMKAREEYGQFFPPTLSAFGYNETIANDEWPLTKEEALRRGFNWSDETAGRYDPPTRDWSTIPDAIADVDESICKEILACSECKKNFRILKSELAFYRKMNVPLPRRCFDCRHMARMRMRNPRKLWHRQCMCELTEHDHGHRAEASAGAGGRCTADFETTYAHGRPEKVFCEWCYQKEIL